MTGLPVADYAAEHDAVLDRDLASEPDGTGDAVRRLRRTTGIHGARLQVDRPRRQAGRCCRRDRCRLGLGLLRRAVLLRQRDRGRSDEPEHRLRRRPVQLRHRLRRHLPLGRRRRDLEEPRLGPAPGLPRARVRPERHRAASSSATTAASGGATDRGGRPTAASRSTRARLADRSTARWPLDRRSSRRSPRNPASRRSRAVPRFPLARLGRHAGQRHAAQRDEAVADRRGSTSSSGDGGQVLVDPTRLRTSSTARTSASARTRLDVPGRRRRPSSRTSPSEGHQPDGPVGLLHPVRAEPGEPEPALPRHVPALPHRQREGAVRRRRQWKAISGDLTSGCTGTAPNGARNCTISAIGVGGGQAVYTGSLDGLRLGQPGRAGQRHPDLDADRHEQAAEPAGARRSPSTGATTGSRTSRTTASTPRRPAARATSTGRTTAASSWADISGQPAGRPGQLGHPRPVVPEHALRRHRRRPVRDLQRRRHVESLAARASRSSAIWQLDLDPSHGSLAAGTHGRGAFGIVDRVTRAGARPLEGRRRRAGRPGERRSPTRSR